MLEPGEYVVSVPMNAGAMVMDLPAGVQRLQTFLDQADGRSRGAYFLEVRRMDGSP